MRPVALSLSELSLIAHGEPCVVVLPLVGKTALSKELKRVLVSICKQKLGAQNCALHHESDVHIGNFIGREADGRYDIT